MSTSAGQSGGLILLAAQVDGCVPRTQGINSRSARFEATKSAEEDLAIVHHGLGNCESNTEKSSAAFVSNRIGKLSRSCAIIRRPSLVLRITLQYRCRANMVHVIQSRPDSGLGFQAFNFTRKRTSHQNVSNEWPRISVNNSLTEMCNGPEQGSHLRLRDFCITEL